MQTDDSFISKRFILSPLALVLVFTIAGFGLIYWYFSTIILERYQDDLIRLARSSSQLLDYLDDYADRTDFDHFADTLAENAQFRITIISTTGTVLGDSRLSYQEVLGIENHGERPEVLAAKGSGVGISRRYSETLKRDLLYVAVTYNSRGRQGFFRVALPLNDLEAELMRQRLTLGGGCLVALIIFISLSLLTSRYLIFLVRKNKEYLEQRISGRSNEINLLQNLGTQLSACNSQAEVLQVIELVTTLLLPRFSGALSLLRASKDNLEIVAAWNGEWLDEKYYSPKDCWALRTGKLHLGNPISGNMSCNHSKKVNQKTLCIPLTAQGETMGAIHFFTDGNISWLPEEERLTRAVAEHASLTLANLKLRENLRQQAIKDPLTGLYNRRFLLETMEHEVSRAVRNKSGLGVLMIDIDHFKRVNDEFGHDIGDFILAEFSKILQQIIRKEDIACRYGGEEFTILLSDTDRQITHLVAEKICSLVREHKFTIDGYEYGPITVSIGAGTFPENDKTCVSLIKKADNALYQAKNAGRNQVVLAEFSN